MDMRVVKACPGFLEVMYESRGDSISGVFGFATPSIFLGNSDKHGRIPT